jgi:hypothetical protein
MRAAQLQAALCAALRNLSKGGLLKRAELGKLVLWNRCERQMVAQPGPTTVPAKKSQVGARSPIRKQILEILFFANRDSFT